MPERDAVVVTGMGAVSPYGWGQAALWRGLCSASPAIGELGRFDPRPHRTHLAAEVPAPPAARPLPAGDTHADRFAVAAAAEALAESGLGDLEETVVGVYFGSSTGGLFESEEFFAARWAGGRPALRHLVSQPPSGPGEAVARAFGLGGPVETISSACSSANLAIGIGLEALRGGEVEVALCGGADSLCRLTHAGFNSLRSVDPGPCRPFRLGREGLTLGEGAAVLVLETLRHAQARGARPLLVVAGAGGSCDAHHMTAPDPSGAGVERAVRAALADAATAPEEIAFVNAHGTGTPLNDAAEWEALRRVFGERASAIPVTSTKGSIGHYLGSAGAVEAVATALCLLHEEVHPTPGDGDVDPACPVDLVRGIPRTVPGARAALSTNFAFGGSNAALVLRRWAELPA